MRRGGVGGGREGREEDRGGRRGGVGGGEGWEGRGGDPDQDEESREDGTYSCWVRHQEDARWKRHEVDVGNDQEPKLL